MPTPRIGLLAACLLAGVRLAAPAADSQSVSGTYPRVEVSFQLPDYNADPFAAEVWTQFQPPAGPPILVPAFYDGVHTNGAGIWRARFTPKHTGHHSVRVTQGPSILQLETRTENLEPREFEVLGVRAPGFVRRDPRHAQRFLLDDGTPYFPLGHNVGWSKGHGVQIVPIFSKMGAAGENWARVWMTHWDGKNLDWVQGKKNAPGLLHLDAARKWDDIIHAAEENGLRLQIVLQHHGQYSTSVNPNWKENPWNAGRGGFLNRPSDFFTHPTAIELTRQKYRYIVARWGYSTSIMAWELFNEVEYTDAFEQKQSADVIRWHSEMSSFIRSIDPNRHLITTSSLPADHPVWRSMDYYQPHAYPADLIVTAGGFDTNPSLLPKPIFYGEMGAKDETPLDDGRRLRSILWPSLMSGGAGAAQYWPWDVVEKEGLYRFYSAAAGFLKSSALPSRELATALPTVETSARTDLKFGPGGNWGRCRQTEFVIGSDGRPIEGLVSLSPYLHGDPRKIADGFPRSASFRIDARQPTVFKVKIGTVARIGAALSLLVDGREVVARDWPAADKDREANEEFSAEIGAGHHTVTIRSVGKDWFYVKSFSLSDYAPALGALCRTSPNFAALWIYHRQGIERADTTSVEDGRITFSGIRPGKYRVVWWDTSAGTAIREEPLDNPGGPVTLRAPTLSTDMAAYIVAEE